MEIKPGCQPLFCLTWRRPGDWNEGRLNIRLRMGRRLFTRRDDHGLIRSNDSAFLSFWTSYPFSVFPLSFSTSYQLWTMSRRYTPSPSLRFPVSPFRSFQFLFLWSSFFPAVSPLLRFTHSSLPLSGSPCLRFTLLRPFQAILPLFCQVRSIKSADKAGYILNNPARV